MFISNLQRSAFLNTIHARIKKGKSTLIISKCGAGKTDLLKQISIPSFNIVQVESLGSTSYILSYILLKTNFTFSPRINKNVEYLKSVCNIKNLVITIDDIGDLRPGFFRYIKRLMEANIPIIMAGSIDIIPFLKENHEDVISRLRILPLEPLTTQDFKKTYASFSEDALDIVSGFSFGNMWIFKEICEEGLEKIKSASLSKVSVSIVQQIIQKYQQFQIN